MKQCYSPSTDAAEKNRPRIRNLALALLFALLSLSVGAQNGGGGSVSGIVKDPNGQPVLGVTVVVPGTTRGTTTDADGRYTIEAATGETLNFSYIGYKQQMLRVNGQTRIDVTLEEDNTSLEEVVVVGYGLQKRRDIVGAVETLSAETLEERNGSSMSISRSLQGAIPGLTMTFSDGKPNRAATIRIRGAENSIGAGGSALVLVDGVETDISTVNPDDIESITVLKDASSTAVYGARGTFGVILMTTKAPQKGRAKVTYNGTYTFYKRATTPQMVTNGYDFTTSFLESYTNAYGTDPANINNVFKFNRTWYNELARRNSDPSFEKWRINNQNAYEYFGNTNWYDVFYRDYTTGHQHNLSVTGGGETASYYVSGRIFEQDGIYNAGDEKYQQFNVKAKGDVRVKPWLRIENTTDFMYRYSHQPTAHTDITSTPMNINRMLNHQAVPVTLVTNPDGSWTEAAVYTGWAGFVEGNSWRKDRKFDMNNRTSVNLDLIKDVLVGNIDVSFYFNQTDRRQAVNSYTFHTGPNSSAERPSGSLYEERSYNRQKVASNATLTYTPRLGDDHSLTVLGGWNIEDYTYKSNLMNREGIIIPGMPNFSLLEGEAITLKDNGSYDWGLVGAFYRISYSYKGKYLFETSGRYDGNSKFPSNQRWGFFPSGSAGWRISEESFLRNAEWLDNLKLRVSVGSAGNGLISDTYAYLSTMSISQSSLLNNGSVFNYTAAPSPIPDGLTWETATTYDLGVDFEAFNGRLNFSADIYRKKTTDMYVVGEELPAVYGNSAPKGNYADMHTDGWEASISWRNTHTVGGKPLSYNIKVSVWDNTSKITRYTSKTGTLPTNYKVNYYEGMTLGEIWGYRCDGLFQSDEEAQTYANYSKFTNRSAKWSAGDPRYLDLNGDGYVNNGNNTIYDHGDLEKIGNTTPRYCYSIQGGIRWNGIGLSMMWQGVGKRDWYPAKESGYFWGQYGRPYSMALPWHTTDRWSPENRGAYWPRLVAYAACDSGTILSQPNTRYLQDASYIRLKNLTIDYNFPKELIGKIGLQALKIYFSGENLLTFSPLKKHAKNYDPEGIYAGDADYGTGKYGTDNFGDGDGYPVMKSYTIGLTLTF